MDESTHLPIGPFVIATTLSDEAGRYRFINLKPGRYQVRCQVLGGYVYYVSGTSSFAGDGELPHLKGEVLHVEHGNPLSDIDFRFAPFKKGTWQNYNYFNGLANNSVNAIHYASDGAIWFGTYGGGVSRCDGKEFVNLTTADGLANNDVWAIYCDADGTMWFGTEGGLSRYDGKEFVTLTQKDGLAHNFVHAIHRDPAGVMWLGTEGGLSRVVYLERSRRDGTGFVTFTQEDGLAHNRVWAVHCGLDGAIWCGTYGGGVSRYDGQRFVNFTRKDGLASNCVHAIHRDPDGVMWFGTDEGGLSRYDLPRSPSKGGFVNFTTKDGLASYIVYAIHRTSDGVMWFGTEGGGTSGYDGIAWTSLDTRDGLAGNIVSSIHQDSDGCLWFGTCDGCITRYRRDTTPPHALIVAVTTDRRYTNLNELCPVTAGTRVTFEYGSIDFKTHPDKRLYRYRMRETRRSVSLHDADWSKPTRKTEIDYGDLPAGEYIFQVQAIDRDLNYSEPATVRVTVQLDARDIKLAALKTEVDHLRREAGRKYQFENIIGRSAAVKQVQALMEKAIDSGLTVLITGETGTGKELVAKAIHFNSPRKDHPLLDLNCGAVPQELVASILFGHRKGAFTGAHESTPGLFEAASGGTVLLDEIGEMSKDAQVHLLRVLQERKVNRLRETESRDVDVRVIAITNRDLAEAVKAGDFREDLYYRLRVFPIHLPALRERLDDLPILAEHFLKKACRQLNKEVDGFGPDVIEMLQSYSWPGNIRELENEIYRAAALVEEGLKLQTYHFSPEVTQGESLIQEMMPTVQPKQSPYREIVDRFERRYIENALQACNGNRTQAAKMLGIDRKSLYERMQRLHIDIPPDIPRKPTNK
ncbi:sigma 54-interacting transcriptional regulator [Candidatus Poribacteria bacterium]|nr:sigma 54-interacting transcriptional regulator [Candidatus Poribacteria bacterium]